MDAHRRDLLRVYRAALEAVDGRRRVAATLTEPTPPDAVHLIAVGKAAEAMAEGAYDAWGNAIRQGLIVTRHGYVNAAAWRSRPVQVIEAGHPIPDAHSLDAGRALLNFLQQAPADAHLLFLISGGSSALAELLADGARLDDLQAFNRHLLSSGLDIHAINRQRKAVSAIKGGRLLGHLGGRATLALLISDVPGDDPAVIGSGLLAVGEIAVRDELPEAFRHLWVPPGAATGEVEIDIIARNADALAAAARRATALGYPVHRHDEFLSGDAAEAGARIARTVADGPAGIHLWGGEPTVTLPPAPGSGGRMQTLALSAALALDGRPGVYLLAAGTDGADGPTEDAGALIDPGTLARCRDGEVDPAQALVRADAGAALAASGDLIQTGPTDTNVMDVVIGLKVEA